MKELMQEYLNGETPLPLSEFIKDLLPQIDDEQLVLLLKVNNTLKRDIEIFFENFEFTSILWDEVWDTYSSKTILNSAVKEQLLRLLKQFPNVIPTITNKIVTKQTHISLDRIAPIISPKDIPSSYFLEHNYSSKKIFQYFGLTGLYYFEAILLELDRSERSRESALHDDDFLGKYVSDKRIQQTSFAVEILKLLSKKDQNEGFIDFICRLFVQEGKLEVLGYGNNTHSFVTFIKATKKNLQLHVFHTLLTIMPGRDRMFFFTNYLEEILGSFPDDLWMSVIEKIAIFNSFTPTTQEIFKVLQALFKLDKPLINKRQLINKFIQDIGPRFDKVLENELVSLYNDEDANPRNTSALEAISKLRDDEEITAEVFQSEITECSGYTADIINIAIQAGLFSNIKPTIINAFNRASNYCLPLLHMQAERNAVVISAKQSGASSNKKEAPLYLGSASKLFFSQSQGSQNSQDSLSWQEPAEDSQQTKVNVEKNVGSPY